jgi:tetratricopeptide (TPR) repeat protein
LNQDGQEQAGMGLAVGDYRNDGLVDLYTGTFSDDYKPLFRNEGHANYLEITPEMAMAEVTYPFLTWSTEFIDYDNDGWKDLFAVNGHVYPQVDKHNWGTSFAQRPFLFHNVKKGQKFEIVPPVEGTGLAMVIPGRGAGFGDLFNNGKIDVVINCMDQVPVLLQNVNPDKHRYEEARKQFEALQALDPDDVSAHYNLSLLYRRMGMEEKAAEQAALFVTKKTDPGAPTYSLDFLRKHPEISTESVPWHMHTDLTSEFATVGGQQ